MHWAWHARQSDAPTPGQPAQCWPYASLAALLLAPPERWRRPPRGGDARCRRARRPQDAALRQPQGRPGLSAQGSRHRVSDRLGVQERRPAGRGDPRVRRLASGARRERHGRLGALEPAERSAYGACAALGGEGGPAAGAARDAALRRPRQGAGVAEVEAGVLVSIIGCDKGWCRVSIGSHRGYIEQTKLWGTYPNETIR